VTLGWAPTPDLVNDLRHCLDAAPRDTREDRFEAWAWPRLLADTGPASLTRDGVPHHFTASAVVLDPTGTRTCLVLHGRLRLWVQPGGHFEPGDGTVAGAAAREVAEETGLRGRVLPGPVVLARHPAPCGVPGADWHLDVQHALIAAPDHPVVSAESFDVAWFAVDDLPDLLAAGVGDHVRRAAARVRAAGNSDAVRSRGAGSRPDAAPPRDGGAPAGAQRPGGSGASSPASSGSSQSGSSQSGESGPGQPESSGSWLPGASGSSSPRDSSRAAANPSR
jgi:8-oxo-dGTP pyrophosphatase MutT (NUDIX family)